MRRGPHAPHEVQEALAQPRRLELIRQHRGERHGDRRARPEHLEQRKVGARDRLEEPLLPEGPRAEALDVGHVGVQDDRQLAGVGPGAGRAQVRHTARKSSARSSGRRAQREVPGGDRRGEAVVERARQAEARVDGVPAQSQGDGVGAEAAGVEEAEHLDGGEVRRAERAELLGAVLLHVPRVPRLLGARRRERQEVRGGDVGHAPGEEHPAEVLEDRVRVLDVLDRLQEDDGVARLGEGLDRRALEAQVLPRVAQPRVLVGLGVRVDADHRGGAAGEHLGAVALAAGHVDHPTADRPRRDPLVDREVAAVPVVLLGHVRQRSLAGELERGHPGRLVALHVAGGGRHGGEG